MIESVNESIDELQGIPATVDRAVTEIDDLGIPVDAMTAQGKPTERIVDAAADLEADAILIAGKTRTPVGKAVFGSVTQGVVLESGRTVIVAGMT
ncbi:MAG: universal stress protein [Halohasta sp.]